MGKNLDDMKLFTDALDYWITEKESIIKKLYGEELSMFYMADNNLNFSENCLKSNIEYLRKEWMYLNPLSEKMRIQKILKLRGINNINLILKVNKSPDIEAINYLNKYWKNSLPSTKEDLYSWNIHVSYRLAFFNFLIFF